MAKPYLEQKILVVRTWLPQIENFGEKKYRARNSKKNFGIRNGNFEKNAVVKNQGTKTACAKNSWRLLAMGNQRGSVWKETIAVSATIYIYIYIYIYISISVEKLHHQIRLRILSCSRISENHREPEVPEAEVPVGACIDGLARITSKELAMTLLCERWLPPECLFYKTKSGCRFGEKCAFAHRQVDEQLTERSKTNNDKSAVAMLKKGNWQEDLLPTNVTIAKNWTYSWRLCFLKKLPQFFLSGSSASIMGFLTTGPAIENHISPKRARKLIAKIKLCAIRCPWFMDEFPYNTHTYFFIIFISCVATARPAGIVVQVFGNWLRSLPTWWISSRWSCRQTLPLSGSREPSCPSFCCVAVWGPPRENPGPRPNDRCLTPCATVRFSVVLCLHRVSWYLRFGVHRVKTLGTVPMTVVPHVPVFAHHPDPCTFWFGQQLGLSGGDALLGPVLLRKHQGATSRYVNGWFWDDHLR